MSSDVPIVDRGGDCDCTTAEELLAKLSSLHDYWKPSPPSWIFRGVSDAERHDLKATAHREKAFVAFGLDCASDASFGMFDRIVEEVVERLRHALDRAGLAIPAVAPEGPSSRRARVQYGFHDRADFPLMALAQHLGLPTPLLDWTSQARVAAYFAAEPAARNGDGTGRLAVWALRRGLEDRVVETGVWEGTEQMTRAVLTCQSAPRASNPNLHAQSGLFTWLHGEKAHTMRLDEFVELAAERCAAHLETAGIETPYMRCLTAPRSCAPKLLRMLSHDGVDGSSMFPGYEGVVRRLKELALWDTHEEEKYNEGR
jgi:hypothetical protein